jgi:vacuolar-type H+-ATPase catalytic subunit A/Vma1
LEILKQNFYSRENAVSYARRFAMNPNPEYRYFASWGDGGGDCSNFVSQCLRAGGARMSYAQPAAWWYNNSGSLSKKQHSWSISWSVAHSLYWCLRERGKKNLAGLRGIEVRYIEMLERGDVIQYEDNRGIIYHSAIITDFTINRGIKEPLISQHSFNAVDIYYVKEKARKMHFMKVIV